MSGLGNAKYMTCQAQRNAAGCAASARRSVREGKLQLAVKLQMVSANVSERARRGYSLLLSREHWKPARIPAPPEDA